MGGSRGSLHLNAIQDVGRLTVLEDRLTPEVPPFVTLAEALIDSGLKCFSLLRPDTLRVKRGAVSRNPAFLKV
jgi:hypothetical protein